MNCIIVDDEYLQHKALEDYIRQVPALHLAGSFTDPVKALAFVKETEVNLIFLDIQMPGLTGIEFLNIIGKKINVIITTAYTDYALAGYDYEVKDYLLKPFSFERFYKAVSKLDHPGDSGFLFVKSDTRILRVDPDDVLYIEGLKDYVSIVTASEKIVTLNSLARLELSLPQQQFIRVHKSYIVSLAKITSIEKDIIMIGNKEIPLGSTYRNEFLKRIERLKLK